MKQMKKIRILLGGMQEIIVFAVISLLLHSLIFHPHHRASTLTTAQQ